MINFADLTILLPVWIYIAFDRPHDCYRCLGKTPDKVYSIFQLSIGERIERRANAAGRFTDSVLQASDDLTDSQSVVNFCKFRESIEIRKRTSSYNKTRVSTPMLKTTRSTNLYGYEP